ncbi:DUF1310 family protein [Streptococcus oricebi]|uniref:DUF1310 family protein n=1 Tax=Streptococcus oricebi TaxID=1547447 RepID=A0ABS5B585_9STRE|nr:DUF1310 family protein [Streptococcus oricebi]MBP2623969.1 hypothetical protein [Streptococcus oricebi]
MNKPLVITLGVLLALFLLVFGGLKLKEMNEHNEMVKIVRSKEAKDAIEEALHNLDPNALTDKGVIKTYEIDEKSISHNPMGGIGFRMIVNNDKRLYINTSLIKNHEGKIEVGGSIIASELDDILPQK